MDGDLQKIMPLRGSILQAGTCQIFSLAENPRWSRVWQQLKSGDKLCIHNTYIWMTTQSNQRTIKDNTYFTSKYQQLVRSISLTGITATSGNLEKPETVITIIPLILLSVLHLMEPFRILCFQLLRTVSTPEQPFSLLFNTFTSMIYKVGSKRTCTRKYL